MKVVYIYRIALLCIMTSAKLIALRLLAVESAYLGLSPQLDMGVCIFLYLLQDLTGTIIFIVGNMLVCSEMYMLTSSFLIANGDKVACMYLQRYVCVCFRKKKDDLH